MRYRHQDCTAIKRDSGDRTEITEKQGEQLRHHAVNADADIALGTLEIPEQGYRLAGLAAQANKIIATNPKNFFIWSNDCYPSIIIISFIQN